jgi:hypothetical protein
MNCGIEANAKQACLRNASAASGGKVPINPDYILSRSRDRIVIRNYEGRVFEYVEGANKKPPLKVSENFDAPEPSTTAPAGHGKRDY